MAVWGPGADGDIDDRGTRSHPSSGIAGFGVAAHGAERTQIARTLRPY
jgi:hypothetical protein